MLQLSIYVHWHSRKGNGSACLLKTRLAGFVNSFRRSTFCGKGLQRLLKDTGNNRVWGNLCVFEGRANITPQDGDGFCEGSGNRFARVLETLKLLRVSPTPISSAWLPTGSPRLLPSHQKSFLSTLPTRDPKPTDLMKLSVALEELCLEHPWTLLAFSSSKSKVAPRSSHSQTSKALQVWKSAAWARSNLLSHQRCHQPKHQWMCRDGIHQWALVRFGCELLRVLPSLLEACFFTVDWLWMYFWAFSLALVSSENARHARIENSKQTAKDRAGKKWVVLMVTSW